MPADAGQRPAAVGDAGEDRVPALGASRLALENEFFRDWGVALRQAGLDNVSFSGGREITEAQNRELGKILALVAAAHSDRETGR